MESLYASVPGVTGILTINVTDSHSATLATATVQCLSTTLEVGSPISVDVGYVSDHATIFTGYVKMIEQDANPGQITITASDILVKAADYFIVPSTPTTPLTVQNMSPEAIIAQLLAMVNLTDLDFDVSNYIWGVAGPIEIKLISIYDYCKMLADLIAWGFWADVYGGINFQDRRPYPMDDDAVVFTIPRDSIITIKDWKNDRNLRNKVVVWGSTGIYAEASAPSPYLPDGFYKSAVVSAPGIIDTQWMAQTTADFNLEVFNRLTRGISATIVGNHLCTARKVIHLDYTNEDLYIYSSEHNWSKEGYITNVELRKE